MEDWKWSQKSGDEKWGPENEGPNFGKVRKWKMEDLISECGKWRPQARHKPENDHVTCLHTE